MRNKTIRIEDDNTFKEKLFELMLNQDDYANGDTIMKMTYIEWDFMVCKDRNGAIMLAYTKHGEPTKKAYFTLMGRLCSYILNECIKRPLAIRTVIPEKKMARYIKFCQKQQKQEAEGEFVCPHCHRVVKSGPLYPYFYDEDNNDVYFASVCPRCGTLTVEKE